MTAAVPTTEKYVAFARRGQEIATAAAEGYAGAFKTYADTVIPQGAQQLDPQASAAGETIKARTEEATERVIDLATEATRRAATATRNGVSA